MVLISVVVDILESFNALAVIDESLFVAFMWWYNYSSSGGGGGKVSDNGGSGGWW